MRQIESEGQCKHFALQRRDVRNRDSPCAKTAKRPPDDDLSPTYFPVDSWYVESVSLTSFQPWMLQDHTAFVLRCKQSNSPPVYDTRNTLMNLLFHQWPCNYPKRTIRLWDISLSVYWLLVSSPKTRAPSQTPFQIQTPWKLLKG